MTEWNVLDSSGWLSFFADGANADTFAPIAEATEHLIVPSITLFEVWKHVSRERSQSEAFAVVAQMRTGRVVDLDTTLALDAAGLSIAHRLALADSIILATARRFDATLWTQEADFDGLQGVRFVPT